MMNRQEIRMACGLARHLSKLYFSAKLHSPRMSDAHMHSKLESFRLHTEAPRFRNHACILHCLPTKQADTPVKCRNTTYAVNSCTHPNRSQFSCEQRAEPSSQLAANLHWSVIRRHLPGLDQAWPRLLARQPPTSASFSKAR